MGALVAVLGAVTALAIAVRDWHRAVNSKMDALLDLTARASHAAGVEQERTRLEDQSQLR